MDLQTQSNGAKPPVRAEPVVDAEGPPPAKPEAAKPVTLSAKAARQLAHMNRLKSKHYAKTEIRRATAAQLQRHALIDYEAMRSAIRRLGRVATLFKPGSFSGTYERALNSEVMSPTLLDTFLRQNFDLKLTPAELGCVVRWMDVNGDGAVDATEFLREFWKFGLVEHIRAKEARRREHLRAEHRERGLSATLLARFASPKPAVVSDTYTVRDLAAAEDALATAAADFDNDSFLSRSIRDVFDGPPMSASELADIVRKHWSVRLTPTQIAAIMATYDVDQNGVVDGHEFYRFFTVLGRRERARRARQAAHNKLRRSRKADLLDHRLRGRYGSHREARVLWPNEIRLNAVVRAKTAPAELRSQPL
mmetsp:Transcript_12035/g.38338  ORF Transcript_12035/g.38338 Transcript_12035/m.38338 type:complete len:364 (+) Transcript_12035:2-1093(+)